MDGSDIIGEYFVTILKSEPRHLEARELGPFPLPLSLQVYGAIALLFLHLSLQYPRMAFLPWNAASRGTVLVEAGSTAASTVRASAGYSEPIFIALQTEARAGLTLRSHFPGNDRSPLNFPEFFRDIHFPGDYSLKGQVSTFTDSCTVQSSRFVVMPSKLVSPDVFSPCLLLLQKLQVVQGRY